MHISIADIVGTASSDVEYSGWYAVNARVHVRLLVFEARHELQSGRFMAERHVSLF